jgi:hypothetical protein
MDELEQTSFADLAPAGPRRGEYVIPDGGRVARCSSCNAQIVWTTTDDDRPIPLSLATVQARDDVRYALSHFVDCPHAKDWSRKKR